MVQRLLVPQDHVQHNVPAALPAARCSLLDFAKVYFVTDEADQSLSTIAAKRRDLGRFFELYHQLYARDRTEEWYASVNALFQEMEEHPSPPALRLHTTMNVHEESEMLGQSLVPLVSVATYECVSRGRTLEGRRSDDQEQQDAKRSVGWASCDHQQQVRKQQVPADSQRLQGTVFEVIVARS